MELKDITSRNLMNKYNNFQFSEEEIEELLYMNIYSAS
jgi:hypothetical protein